VLNARLTELMKPLEMITKDEYFKRFPLLKWWCLGRYIQRVFNVRTSTQYVGLSEAQPATAAALVCRSMHTLWVLYSHL
jgi:hypothetical protein